MEWLYNKVKERQSQYTEVIEMLFDEMFRPLERVEFVPLTNIVKKEDAFDVVLAVPGYLEDQLQIAIENGVLEVQGHVSEELQGEMYLRREIRLLPFRYRVELPEGAEAEQIDASLHDGLLNVHIPLRAKQLIPVRVHSVDAPKHLEAKE
jgi:HSP20 family molecular chaperone IbpA